jgi:flagellar L-ring protein precursor FlgH
MTGRGKSESCPKTSLAGYALALTLALGAVAPAAHADSLWKPQSSSLFTDQKARKVGDLVTILIVENTTANQSASTSVSKKEQTDVAKGTGPILSLLPKLGFSASGSSAAQGSTTRSSTFTSRMSAKVVAVEPNGNLVIEGSRFIGTNKDTQALKISGTIRPKDIKPDNTVQSSLIADAKLDITGKGPITERQKPGIISRLFRFIF